MVGHSVIPLGPIVAPPIWHRPQFVHVTRDRRAFRGKLTAGTARFPLTVLIRGPLAKLKLFARRDAHLYPHRSCCMVNVWRASSQQRFGSMKRTFGH
jgi:hypothetical protein